MSGTKQRSGGRQSHHWDGSVTAPLLVQREHSGKPILSKSVQPVSVSSICFTCDKATTARAYVQLAPGVSAQIVIPRGMPRTSVIRSNQYYVTTVSEVSDRHFSSFATMCGWCSPTSCCPPATSSWHRVSGCPTRTRISNPSRPGPRRLLSISATSSRWARRRWRRGVTWSICQDGGALVQS